MQQYDDNSSSNINNVPIEMQILDDDDNNIIVSYRSTGGGSQLFSGHVGQQQQWGDRRRAAGAIGVQLQTGQTCGRSLREPEEHGWPTKERRVWNRWDKKCIK